MNRVCRIFLSILLCLIFIGFSIATFSDETLITLYEKDMAKHKSYDAYFYFVWHFMYFLFWEHGYLGLLGTDPHTILRVIVQR